jgi:hypothetical protein
MKKLKLWLHHAGLDYFSRKSCCKTHQTGIYKSDSVRLPNFNVYLRDEMNPLKFANFRHRVSTKPFEF